MTPVVFAMIVLILPTFLLSLYAQMKVSGTYNRYKKVRSRGGITGAEAAAYVMRSAGINNVEIAITGGHLTDHYDPVRKRLVLSEENARGTSLAALGVAAHEAGHAIQDKEGYSMLRFRMALVPVTSFASQMLPFVILGGFFLGIFQLYLLGAAIYAILTLFQLVTLPVEFDASKRATAHLSGLGMITAQEMPGVKATLNAAALTYVAAFLTSLAWMVYFILASRR
jgi:Zn-dependent membrane protease YugP